MLFNSYDFIFLFLVPVVLGFWGLWFVLTYKGSRKGDRINSFPVKSTKPFPSTSTKSFSVTSLLLYFLIIASIVFYAQWSLEHLALLLGSVFVNYIFAYYVYIGKGTRMNSDTMSYETGRINSDTMSYEERSCNKINSGTFSNPFSLTVIIVLNLIPLLYYKYSYFLNMVEHSIVLPLAISFFTFQQIAFQVDLYKGKIDINANSFFREYLFFILFFPQLIAGPIVHYNELIPQIRSGVWRKFKEAYFSTGVVLFSIGLFKKVVLADNLAVIANNSFANVSSSLSSYDAWIGIFAYSFQIYFDFSGYADMAIGLALMFGIKLPINFNSPYKSRNIIEFWRNWHITLSNFLKEHLYIPLGGNRVGLGRASFNIMVTMVIGGVWHGAGWTFLLWGIAHGLLLVGVHLFSFFVGKVDLDKVHKGDRINPFPFMTYVNLSRFMSYMSVMLTFLAVTLLWVLFRADSFEAAVRYYEVLFSLGDFTPRKLPELVLVLVSLFVVWALPNSLEFSGYGTRKDARINFGIFSRFQIFVVALMFFVSLKIMASSPAQTFVYFNF